MHCQAPESLYKNERLAKPLKSISEAFSKLLLLTVWQIYFKKQKLNINVRIKPKSAILFFHCFLSFAMFPISAVLSSESLTSVLVGFTQLFQTWQFSHKHAASLLKYGKLRLYFFTKPIIDIAHNSTTRKLISLLILELNRMILL